MELFESLHLSLYNMLFALYTYRKQSDEELIELYQTSVDKKILQVVYERYGRLVIGLCMKYLKNAMDAEDMTSFIFEKLPERILRQEIRYFKSWLYQLSKNECLMQLRKKKNYTVELNDSLLEAEENTEEKQQEEKDLQRMEVMILKLKADQRNCITLFYIEELSYQNIAEQLKLEVKTVKSHIQNGKRNLRILMDADHDE